MPISVKKFKNAKKSKVMTHLDFFVVSGLSSFNNGMRDTKGNFLGGDVFIMQRYVPSQGEHPLIYRGFWKKNKGFKIYKLTSVYPYNG